MIIRHSLPNKAYTKLDRRVFTNPKLTDGAVRLYGYLCGLRNGADFSDKYIVTALNISQAVLTRRKKELKDSNLILVEQISPRVFVIYIGYTNFPASDVKSRWESESDVGNL